MHNHFKLRFLSCIVLAPVILFLFYGCAARVIHPGEAYQLEQWTTVVEQGQRWLERNPDDFEARLMTGEAAFALTDTVTAMIVLSPVARDIENTELMEAMSLGAVSTGDLYLARELLMTLMRTESSGNIWTQYLAFVQYMITDARHQADMGDRKFAMQDWSAAVNSYRQALQSHPQETFYQARLNLAQAELLISRRGTEKRSIALEKIELAKNMWRGSSIPYWTEGDVYFQLGEAENALQAFQRALDMGLEEPYRSLAETMIDACRTTLDE